MRTIIDGYNVMFAAGLMGEKFRPEKFRKVRQRFLNDLAAMLDSTEAHLTTVVFDANDAPDHIPASIRHKGISVLFAVDHDSADERIEDLIRQDSNPRSLTVVSSDHRIQRAASRKKAKVVSADEFLTMLDSRKERKRPAASTAPTPIPSRSEIPSAEEAAFWLAEFSDVVDSPEAREIARGDPSFPTDDELAQIEREVEEEFRRR
jgi:predicted RNA-binding protein with PIN domain